jgi:hypothetical protein
VLAMALIGDPKIVVLDEPTTGLDPLTRRQIWEILQQLKKGRSTILTTVRCRSTGVQVYTHPVTRVRVAVPPIALDGGGRLPLHAHRYAVVPAAEADARSRTALFVRVRACRDCITGPAAVPGHA